MCFGAGASFTAGAVLTAIGTASLSKVRSKNEVLFASYPLFFAIQQITEGMIWLSLSGGRLKHFEQGLTLLYLFFAYFFWPIFSPIAAYWLEPEEKRREMIFPLIFLGLITSFYLLFFLIKCPLSVFAIHKNLHYQVCMNRQYPLIGVYLSATFLPFLLSSYKPLVFLGIINIFFCGVAYYFYHHGFDSVWCFFAAILSIGIYFCLHWLHGQRYKNKYPVPLEK